MTTLLQSLADILLVDLSLGLDGRGYLSVYLLLHHFTFTFSWIFLLTLLKYEVILMFVCFYVCLHIGISK